MVAAAALVAGRPLRRWAALIAAALLSAAARALEVPPPPPVLPIPSARQLAWQKRELAMFFHFGMNTFTDSEWGTGAEDPHLFDPPRLDARQWVRAARDAGFKTVILTAKHHDGFCLWPSKYTRHSVASSPWRGGRGDVVRDVARAAAALGVALGLYLSPWDRHEPSYGDAARYNLFYEAQLRELLTNYGPVAESWFDGANGGNVSVVYDFPAWFALERQLQPTANMFSGQGPDIRWVGNEAAQAGTTCWSTFNNSKSDVVGTNETCGRPP